MQLFFRTRKLQKDCSSEKEMSRTFGAACARKLGQRLAELRAADNLGQVSRVPPARCHELAGDRKGRLSVYLEHPARLIFIPANDPVPRHADGGLIWDEVTEIEIIEIVDYHKGH